MGSREAMLAAASTATLHIYLTARDQGGRSPAMLGVAVLPRGPPRGSDARNQTELPKRSPVHLGLSWHTFPGHARSRRGCAQADTRRSQNILIKKVRCTEKESHRVATHYVWVSRSKSFGPAPARSDSKVRCST